MASTVTQRRPMMPQRTSKASNDAPKTSEEDLKTSKVAPKTSNDAPTTSEINSATSKDAPKTSNIAPKSSNDVQRRPEEVE